MLNQFVAETLKLELQNCARLNESAKRLNESSTIQALQKVKSMVKTPEDVQAFMDRYADEIAKAERELSGKNKGMFRKAVDFVWYAIKNGVKFIAKHFDQILILLLIIVIAIWWKPILGFSGNVFNRLFSNGSRNDVNVEQVVATDNQLDQTATARQTTSDGSEDTIDVSGDGPMIETLDAEDELEKYGTVFGHGYHGTEDAALAFIRKIKTTYPGIITAADFNNTLVRGMKKDGAEPDLNFIIDVTQN